MDPLIIGAIGQGVNALSQLGSNIGSRAFSREMYAQQHEDSIEFWKMQNEYNTPWNQMQRLKQAGLNPAMIYGSGGSTGGMASAPKVPTPMSAQFTPPQLGNVLTNIYDLEVKERQSDMLAAQQTTEYTKALQNLANTDDRKFDTYMKKQLEQVSMQAAEASVANTQANTKYTLDNNDRQAAMHSYGLIDAAQKILQNKANLVNTREQKRAIVESVRNMKLDGRLKKLDIEFRQMGIGPNDSLLQRMLGRVLQKYLLPNGLPKVPDFRGMKDRFDNPKFDSKSGIVPPSRSGAIRKFFKSN